MNSLITGAAGSGKTTIAAELARRGYNTVNMDSVKGLCAWINLSTGKPDSNFKRDTADDWLDKYDWLWNGGKLKELVEQTTDTFYSGSSGNQAEYYSLFEKVFLLETDEELIRERVLGDDRGHDYGSKPGEVEAILGYYEELQNSAKAIGAIVISARKPVSEIADLILAEAKSR